MLRYLVFGLALFSFTFFVKAQTVDSTSPSAVITELNSTLMDVMKNAVKLKYKGRYQKLEPVIKRSHDLATIARITVGRNWRKFSEPEKQQLVDKFTEYSVATYADRFNGYGGEAFIVQGEEPIKGSKMLVKALLTVPEGEDIQFEYILSEKDGSWHIVNIIVDGVSDIALKRSQFTTTLSNEGLDALLGWLSEKVTGYEKKAE
ncbi:MAG: ABC transporter substrate-binding protein [Methylococcales bacterium]